MRRAGAWSIVFMLAGGAGVACNKDSLAPINCSGAAVMTTLPIAASAIRFVTPIGNMGPPVHTIPTDHVGFYLNGTVIPVSAPAKLRIDNVVQTTYLTSPFRQGVVDYAIETTFCGGVTVHIGHIQTVTAKISGAAGSNCQQYSTANETVRQCRSNNANVSVGEGEPLGTVGAASIGAFDFGVYDANRSNAFVNVARYSSLTRYAVCPYDYFSPELKAQLYARIGDGLNLASGETPACGAMSVDLAGSARGVWVLQSAPVNQAGDETNFLVLAPYPLSPQSKQTVADGPGLASASNSSPIFPYPLTTTGRVNRQFSDVHADGLVYCYYAGSGTLSYFVRLEAGDVLAIQRATHAVGATPCIADPSTWTIGASAVRFIR